MATRTSYIGTEVIGDTVTKANLDKLPNGLVGYLQIFSPSGTSTGTLSVTGLSPCTITAQTGRRYKIIIHCLSITTTGATGSASITIWDTTGATQLAGHVLRIDGAGAGNFPGGVVVAFHEPAAGSQAYGFRTVSTLTCSTSVNAGAATPASIWVFDDGPTF